MSAAPAVLDQQAQPGAADEVAAARLAAALAPPWEPPHRDEGEVSPQRLARAERLVAGAPRHATAPPPYPAAEAVDPVDAVLLGALERLGDPRWVARHWLGGDERSDER